MSDRRQHGVRMPNIAMRLMWCVRHCQWSTHNDVEFMSICRWRCFHDFFIFCMFLLLILTDFSIRCGIQVMQQTAIQTFGTSRNIDGKKTKRFAHRIDWVGARWADTNKCARCVISDRNSMKMSHFISAHTEEKTENTMLLHFITMWERRTRK